MPRNTRRTIQLTARERTKKNGHVRANRMSEQKLKSRKAFGASMFDAFSTLHARIGA